MSREKQEIEDMAIDLCDCHTEFDCGVVEIYTDYDTTAQKMFAKGYRRASDVAREIFEEIEKIRAKELLRCEILRESESDLSERKYWEGGEHSLRKFTYWFNELKKKYVEDVENGN